MHRLPLLGTSEQVTSGLLITRGHVPQFELYTSYWIAGHVRETGLQVKIILDLLDKKSTELVVIFCGGGYGSVTVIKKSY